MNTGYLALFGVIVAYSAYQGTTPTGTTPIKETSVSKASEQEEKAALRLLGAGANQTEAFPTISGGICKLRLDGTRTSPCGPCTAICPADDLRNLLTDYFRDEGGKDEAPEELAAHWNVPRLERPRIKFVIATLPDPVHTHMALWFDRFTETIERAAQTDGYLFSRAWMPWENATHSESTDFTVRLAQEKLRDAKESLPGLMIFQRSGSPGTPASILFVFVVGETPTAGIRKEQFQNALNIRHSIVLGNPNSENENVLRVLGPTFSGSLRSLNAILYDESNRNQFSSILVRSGSVSSYRAACEFNEVIHQEWPDNSAEQGQKSLAGSRPDFVSFQFNDEYQEFYLSLFFRQRHNFHSHVAILSEDETTFGNQEKPKERKDDDGPCGGRTDPSSNPPKQGDFEYMRFYFPRGIAQLRDAYQRDVKANKASGNTGNPQPAPGLPLSLGLTGNDDDSVESYSPLQTPLSEESILQSIVASLRKDHAKVVIIRATDPLDVVFLSRYLRENYPQARLITVGVDLLMIHDLYDPRFHGILAVATYPLLNGVEFPVSAGTEHQQVHRLFSDSYSVGEFNAFESLLAGKTQLDGMLPQADYAQFGFPTFLKGVPDWRAHLWLTAIGRQGFWPVAVLDDGKPDWQPDSKFRGLTIPAVAGKSQIENPFTVHFSIGWTILWTIGLVLTVFLAILLAYPHAFTRSEILARFTDYPSKERNGLLFAACMLLVAVQTLFLFPMILWMKPFGFRWDGWEGAFTGMEISTLFYGVSVVLLGLACYKGFTERKDEQYARAGRAICIATVILAFGLMALLNWGCFSTRLGAFVYRYVDVGSGVSPCLPLLFLLAAWIWWCWQSLTGIASIEEKSVVLPPATVFDEPPGGKENGPSKQIDQAVCDRVRLKMISDRLNTCLWALLAPVPLGVKWKVAISAGMAFLIIFFWMRPDEIAEAFEFGTYKVLYWILLYSCLLLLCYLVMHIVSLWLEYRNLLQAIDRLPLRRGFKDLKTLTWKPLWKLAGSGRQDFSQFLGGEIDALGYMQKSGIPEEGPLAEAIKAARIAEKDLCAEYDKVLNGRKDEHTASDLRSLFHTLQTRLAATAAQGLVYAKDQWKTEAYKPQPSAPSEIGSKDKSAALAVASDPKTRAVEHFLCLFYMNVILVPLRRLQTLILAMAGVFVFVLLSYSSYPFESRESFHALLISIFFAMSLAVGIVYGQMYANPLLSLITNTEPGELGLDFWVKLGSFVFVPFLSLVSMQFPELNSFLFSWLQPALQSVK